MIRTVRPKFTYDDEEDVSDRAAQQRHEEDPDAPRIEVSE